MDTEGSREESISTRESFQINLPMTKKKGNYRPSLHHFTLIKTKEDQEGNDPKSKDLKKIEPSFHIKKSKSRHKKQKVAILSWDCSHEGLEAEHIFELATSLAKDGQEIHIFTRGDKQGPSNQKIHGVYVHHIHIDPKLPLLKSVSIFTTKICERVKRLESNERPFDVIHCYNWQPAKAVKNLQNGISRRIICTLHPNGCGKRDDEVGTKQDLFERELVKASDRIVCFDPGIKITIQSRFSLPEEKISTLKQGFNWQDYQWLKDPGEVKKKYDLWPLDPLVLFVGGLDHANGPDILVDAIPALLKNTPQLRFLLVGDGDLMWPIKVKAHYLLFEHAIRLIGHKEGKDVQALFQAADIVVIPNRLPTTPFQLLASWSAKKPVVVTHAGGGGLIKHLENGIQVYDNPNSIVWGVERILFDWDTGNEIAQRGWDEIQSHYTWDVIGQKIEDIYHVSSPKRLKRKKPKPKNV